MSTPAPARKHPRIIELVRVSTDKQDNARQRDELAQFVAEEHLEVARTLELHGVSGTETLNDQQVQQVLRDLNDPDVDGIALSSLDRLFRPGKRYGQFAILDYFVDAKKKIWSVKEGEIDPASDRGYATCVNAGAAAGIEWRELKRRSSNGISKSLRRGEITHTTPRFGLRYVNKHQPGGKRFEIVEQNAKWVRKAFEWARQAVPAYRIARRFVDAGVVSQGYNGKPGKVAWSRQVILQMLKSRIYIGEYTCRGITITNPAIIPPIIDRDQFDEVQAVLATSRAKHIGRPARNPYLLRGLMWCARCGRRCLPSLGKRQKTNPRPFYRCGNVSYTPYTRICPAGDVPMVAVERTVWLAIWELLTQPELLLRLGREHFDSIEHPEQTKTQELESEQKRLESRRDIIRRMIQEGIEDYSKGLTQIREITTRLKEIDAQLRSTGKVANFPTVEQTTIALRSVTQNEPQDYAGRREVLDGILDLRVVFDDQEHQVEITGTVPIPNQQSETSGPKKCNGDLGADVSSFAPIPFKILRRVA